MGKNTGEWGEGSRGGWTRHPPRREISETVVSSDESWVALLCRSTSIRESFCCSRTYREYEV